LKRRDFITLFGGAAAAWPLAGRAKQAERMRRIGVLMGYPEGDPQAQANVTALLQGLQNLGWIEGRNVQIDYRWAGGDPDKAQTFARELIAIMPDVMVPSTNQVTRILQQETRTIPIVFAFVGDPVGSGFAASLARPGRNITGFANFENSIGGKWVELLKEIAPRVRRVALIFNPETQPAYATFLRSIEAAAPSFAVEPITTPVHSVVEIEDAMAALGREAGGSFIVIPDVFTSTNHDPIVALAARYRLPALYPFPFFARKGGLVSYGIDVTDLFRRSASYIDRILRGTKPGELPVQTPNKFEFVINLKTARALGLQIPDKLVAIADEVIE